MSEIPETNSFEGFCPLCAPKVLDNEVVRPVTVMKHGVYNGALKDRDALKASTKFWEGKEIIVYINDKGELDHPPAGITTSIKQVVGQLRDVVWDDEKSRIRADAHIYRDMCPNTIYPGIAEGNIYGVSGAYFCDKVLGNGIFDEVPYDRTEINYLPNNLAIVGRPACELPDCGINTNSETEGFTNVGDSMVEGVTTGTSTGPILDGFGVSPNTIVPNITINIPDINKQEKGDKMVISEEDYKKLEVEVNSLKEVVAEKDKKIAEIEVEKNSIADALKKIEVERMSEQFLAQFPEVNRERAKVELLPIYLEKPTEVVLNSVFKELFVVKPDVSQGAEFVQPQVELNAEDKAAKELGVPDIETIKKMLGI